MMRLEEILPDVLRRWWLVLLAALVAGAAGYVVVNSEPDEYSVSVRLVAVAEPADYWLDLYAKNRLATYEPLINNYAFVQGALAEAELTLDPVEAQRVLEVAHTSNQNTLTITVVDTDAERAANIANAIQFAFIRLNDEQNASLIERVERDPETFTPRIVLTAIETAGPPTDPVGTSAVTTAIAAALLGALAGGVVVVFLIYRDDALRSAEDIDRHLARPVLAIVSEDLSTAER
jgi:capsular polysaccharide biosynthesis protein